VKPHNILNKGCHIDMKHPMAHSANGQNFPIKTLYELRDAIVTPTVINRENKTFSGCVYDREGKLFRPTQRTSRNVMWKPADSDSIETTEVCEEIGGSCIYLGHFTGHYGHFLLETLSRFWIFDQDISYDKVVFQPFVLPVPKTSFSPAKVCFDCFSIKDDKVLIIKKRARFENLLVPTSLMTIYNKANEEQILIYKKIIEHCKRSKGFHKSSPSRIYLSRKNLGIRRMTYGQKFLRLVARSLREHSTISASKKRRIINEDEIEKLFVSFGFEAIYPEQIPFEEQVLMYSNADIISGFEGSAMHNSVFMKEGSLAITIRSLKSTDIRNQIICNSLSKVWSEFIDFNGKTIDELSGAGEFDTHYLRKKLEELI
jgi:capsular polysaccharide biosynthesis protein